MIKQSGRPRAALIAIQCLFVGAAGGVLMLAPPAQGAMLIVPPFGNPAAAIDAAVRADAVLIARGPLPGSVVVRGDRDAMLAGVLAAGAVIIAARPAGCGDVQ
jgi:hypothetical protein